MVQNACLDNDINSLTLSTNLTEISDYAFYKNNFSGITIPDSIEIIGEGPFTTVLGICAFVFLNGNDHFERLIEVMFKKPRILEILENLS